jgi:restriction endonuclease S subunit
MVVNREHNSDEQSWLYRPSFPDDWERCPLYSMAHWTNGLAFRDFQFSEIGKPIIKIAEIKDGITDQTKFTNQKFDDAVFVKSGDMLFSWSGQPETSIDVFWWRGPDGWLNQHIFKVTPIKRLDPTFFFFVLRYLKRNFIGIARNKQTTGLGHVTRRDIENIEAAFPPLGVQKAIATVLGALDDKIELNRKMNATLEAMARALFQSWFIDFDPVRAKLDGRPLFGLDESTATFFPASFQESPLGPIPHGWKVKPLSELTTLITKGTTPTQDDIANASDPESRINYIRVNAIDASGSMLADKLTNIPGSVHIGVLKRSILHSKDVLYTIAGTIGRMALTEDWVLPANTNQAVAIIRPEPHVPPGFLILTLGHERFRQELHSNIVHAVQANLSLGMLSKSRVVVPPDPVLCKLFKPIDDALMRISANRAQSRTLTLCATRCCRSFFRDKCVCRPRIAFRLNRTR